MKSKTRYNIHVAKRHQVEVKEMTTQQGFQIFCQLYFETTKRQHYRGHDPEYHQYIFQALKKEIAHIFVSFYKEIPLAAMEIFIFNDVAFYPYGGSSTEYRNVMAPNLLMWEVIRFARNSGCRTFDMWGSLPPKYFATDVWSGFTRFKQGFGTEFIELIGSFDVVIDSILYNIYGGVEKIRRKLL